MKDVTAFHTLVQFSTVSNPSNGPPHCNSSLNSTIYLTTSNNHSLAITTLAKTTKHNTVCHWHIFTDKPYNLNVTITDFVFQGVVTDACRYGGAFVLAPNIIGHMEMVFNLCRKTLTSGYVTYISSRQQVHLVVIFYSGYSEGSLEALVSLTTCIGLSNTCFKNHVLDTWLRLFI